MIEFTELMASLRADGDAWTVDVSDDWLQGRTVYGGLAAALCLEAALRAFPDAPPLRSAQMTFVGPATGRLRISPATLRRGKSTLFAGVELSGEAGLATRATFCFGAARPSALLYGTIAAPEVKPPDQFPAFFRHLPGLNFAQHFDGRLAGGHAPFSQAGDPTMTLWLRHRDAAVRPAVVPLLALADVPPPAALVLFEKPAPISTMTWSVDLLTDQLSTDEGWWLVRTAAENVAGGYSSQSTTIWNATGTPVMACRQNIAVFI